MFVIPSVANIKNISKFFYFPFLRNLPNFSIFESCFFHTFQSLLFDFSSTTHTPVLLLPSCRMILAFCITDKSRSMVLNVTDKVSAICLAVTNGFALITDMIIR